MFEKQKKIQESKKFPFLEAALPPFFQYINFISPKEGNIRRIVAGNAPIHSTQSHNNSSSFQPPGGQKLQFIQIKVTRTRV
jgi:hypothetical protein